MYTIGEFSKIGSVSVKTLRYYDEIGLLHPASVDEKNHYRYYSDEQIDQLLYITELKVLDLHLEQIKAVMESSDASLLEHFLTERAKQIGGRIREDIWLRQRIEKKIREIQSGGIKMNQNENLAVEAKEFAPTVVMGRKATIAIEQIGTVIGAVYEDIFKNGLKPNGPVMTFYLDEEFRHENVNVEVCIPVAEGEEETLGAGGRDLEKIDGVRMLAPGLCATCLYRGVYSGLGKAYAAVLRWIGENGYHITNAPFDCYMNSPRDVENPEELITQVWFPVGK